MSVHQDLEELRIAYLRGKADGLERLLERIDIEAHKSDIDPKAYLGLKVAVDLLADELRKLRP